MKMNRNLRNLVESMNYSYDSKVPFPNIVRKVENISDLPVSGNVKFGRGIYHVTLVEPDVDADRGNILFQHYAIYLDDDAFALVPKKYRDGSVLSGGDTRWYAEERAKGLFNIANEMSSSYKKGIFLELNAVLADVLKDRLNSEGKGYFDL